MPEIELLKPELETRALTVVDEAKALKILDQVSLNMAGSFVTDRIKPLLAEADATFDEPINKAFQAHRAMIAAKNKVTDPLKNAEKILKLSIAVFRDEQERRRLAEERRLREEAERIARAERDAEVARVRAEQERQQREAEALREREIEQAEKEGRTKDALWLCQAPITTAVDGLADAIASEPIQFTAPTVALTFTMPKGITPRENWHAELVSLDELIMAAAVNKSLRCYLEFNEKAANATARAAKQTMSVPGIRVASDTGIAAKRV